MDLKSIKSFIQLAKSEGVSELKYESKEVKIAVNFNAAPGIPISTSVYSTGVSANSQIEIKSNATSAKSNLHEIKSPFVGTFYTSPSPGKPNFVKVGDKVSKGQTLCILEAMKIMNEIESDVNGEIVELCLENESLVEFGQVLVRVKI